MSRDIAATATAKAWTAYEAKFKINKEEFTIRYRSGVRPDEDADLQITLFRANRDWPSVGEVKVKKDTTKVFAVNATAE
jgi:hypothetical protein